MPSARACFFFHRGGCRNGNACRFSHDSSFFVPVTTAKKQQPESVAYTERLAHLVAKVAQVTAQIQRPVATQHPATQTLRPVEPLPTLDRPILEPAFPDRTRPDSPLLTLYPRAPDDISPEARWRMMALTKTHIIRLINGGQTFRAADELSACLHTWGFATVNQIDNMCITAMTCSSKEFSALVHGLS